jgi:hypothetical protein
LEARQTIANRLQSRAERDSKAQPRGARGRLEKFKRDLVPYEVSRGTIRFPLCDSVPVKLKRKEQVR